MTAWKKLIAFFLLLVSTTTFASQTIEQMGDIGQFVLPGAALTAVLFHHDKKGALQFAESYAATIATVYILKPLINEKRPNGGHDSFPSGHTASAFAGAAFLQMRYGWKYGIPAYLGAAFVGYSRIESRNHWIQDVVAGAVLGIGYNLLFTRKYDVDIAPIAEKNGAGVEVSAHW